MGSIQARRNIHVELNIPVLQYKVYVSDLSASRVAVLLYLFALLISSLFHLLLVLLKVEVEALVLEGSKLTTVLIQVKLEAAVLILGQKKICALNW